MNSLHIIAKAPTSASIAELNAVINEEDVLIFIEDGVYFARTEFSPQLHLLPNSGIWNAIF